MPRIKTAARHAVRATLVEPVSLPATALCPTEATRQIGGGSDAGVVATAINRRVAGRIPAGNGSKPMRACHYRIASLLTGKHAR